jgi:hypothetical protein
MGEEAASGGFFQSDWGKHPRLQLLTVAELFAGQTIDYPHVTGVDVTFKPAPKAKKFPRSFHQDLFAKAHLLAHLSVGNAIQDATAAPAHGSREPARSGKSRSPSSGSPAVPAG